MSNKMQTLSDLIKDTKLDEQGYVYYDADTGDVKQVGTDSYSGYDKLAVKYEMLEDILSGKEQMEDHIVFFNTLKKEWIFKKKKDKSKSDITYTEYFEMPYRQVATETMKITEDIVIVQNVKEQIWKLKIGYNAMNELVEYSYRNLIFNITQPYDPNILYDKLEFDVESLMNQGYTTLPFHYPFEINGDDISIFTNKLFNTYIYEKVV